MNLKAFPLRIKQIRHPFAENTGRILTASVRLDDGRNGTLACPRTLISGYTDLIVQVYVRGCHLKLGRLS